MTNEKKNKPVATLRDGVLKVNVWENDSDKGKHYSIDGVTRSYTNSEGKWLETRSLSNGDILRSARLLERAYDQLVQLRESSKSEGS